MARELRATLALAWPLILANLTQQVIQATDVLLMGRLGAIQLAAATLALNLTYTFNLFLLGLRHRLLADDGDGARPALQRRARRPADLPRRPVADRHRHAALLAAAVARRRLDARLRHIRRNCQPGQTFLRAYMWCTAPWLLFQLLRNFVAALERPRIVFWLSLGGIALNALLSWSLIFGHFGLARLRAGRRRHRQHAHLDDPVRRADRRDPSRTKVPALSAVRQLVAVRPGSARWRWSASAGRSASRWRWKWACLRSPLISWAGLARLRSPPMLSRCKSPR